MNAEHGFDTQLLLEDNPPGSGVFTELAAVGAISGPSLSMDTNEVTNRDSPERWREYIGGLKDAGEVSFDIYWNMTEETHGTVTGLLQDFHSSSQAVARLFKIIWPDTAKTVWLFNGLITGFDIEAPYDDAMTANITIKISGKPTLKVIPPVIPPSEGV